MVSRSVEKGESYLGTTLEPDSSSAPLADLLPADLCWAASMFRGSTKLVAPSKLVGLSNVSPFSSWDMFSTSPCSVPKIDSASIGFIERGDGWLAKEIGEPLHFIALLPGQAESGLFLGEIIALYSIVYPEGAHLCVILEST